MNSKFFRNAMVAFMMVVFAGNLLVSCNGDDDKVTVDKTVLDALISDCEQLVAEATTGVYPQKAIEVFQTAINTAKTASGKTGITQIEVDNLATQLTEAKNAFLEAAYEDIPQSALLIGLTFNEGQGSELTASGKNLKAVLKPGPSEIFGENTGLPTFVDGKNGKAMHFTRGAHLAIDNYSANDFLGKKLSVSVWLKPDDTRAGNYIMSFNYWNSWKLQLQEQNKPFFTVKTAAGHVDADNEAKFSVTNGNWTHLIMTMDLDNEKLCFYINGQLTKEWSKTDKPNLTGSVEAYINQLPLLIGACTTYAEAKASWEWSWDETPEAWDYFLGAMDELKVYNIALTQGQVTKLYESEK